MKGDDHHEVLEAHLLGVGGTRALVERVDHLAQPSLLDGGRHVVDELPVRVGLLAKRVGEHEGLVVAHLGEGEGEGEGAGEGRSRSARV